MHTKAESKSIRFFSQEQSVAKELADDRETLLKQMDFNLFQKQSLQLIKIHDCNEAYLQWQLFCEYVKQLNESKSEKMLLMQTAFHCLENPLEHGELAQLITLTRHLKSLDGLQLIQILLQAKVPKEQRQLSTYLAVFQLLMDLYELPGIYKVVQENLPRLNNLLEKLHVLHNEHIATKYPERNLDTVIERFAKQDDQIQFPLQAEELTAMKRDYIAIKNNLLTLKTLSEATLQENLKNYAKAWRDNKDLSAKLQMIAIITETIRRKNNILPYDTQILSLLALINTPDKLKGRIAQIKTGEGKSTIIAMLAAFMGSQGYFVDIVTSSSYLAKRDCKKYEPFFKALGLSTSNISHQEPKQKHFHAQILYGTNTDFEFSYLRDGLYNTQLRRSRRFDGELIERDFEVVIIDEADNLFLDEALSSAQMGIRAHHNLSWIYEPILRFVRSKKEDIPVTLELINELRGHLTNHIAQKSQKYQEQLTNFSDAHLKRQFESAHTAHFKKQKNKDYLVAFRKDKPSTGSANEPEIIIVDYSCTGRTNEGSQWQHGIHQYLQIKENLKPTTPTKTGASVSHPTFFNLYQHVFGLTGTMGEIIERQEIQNIYKVDSFDVPPHHPSLRKRAIDFILPNKIAKWETLLQSINHLKQKGLPTLILFKSIQESNDFSDYLMHGYCLNFTKAPLNDKSIDKNTVYVEICQGKEGSFIKYTVISPEQKRVLGEINQSELNIDISSLTTREEQKQLLSTILTITAKRNHTLYKKSVKHQLLNETQREAEDYLVAQAGEPGMVTVATNTAGRGTDIILAPESKENGGLQMIFTFYPDNLRVEGQGFGRAGRQGQPGSCWMVLDETDESICDLLKSKQLNPRTFGEFEEKNSMIVNFNVQLAKHMVNQSLNTRPISAEPIIHLLNNLRTTRIQQESIKRSECAKQEQLYFGKLQEFFNKMAKVYALVKDNSFKNRVIQHCTSGFYQTDKLLPRDESNPNWTSLEEMAKLLMNQSQQRVSVDWSTFAAQFSETYLRHICSLWGTYYSKLKDPIEIELNREGAFQEVETYLLAPEKMAVSLLCALFSDEFCRKQQPVAEKTFNPPGKQISSEAESNQVLFQHH